MRMFWEQVVQDLRYAVRMMAAHPLFTGMAALSLALGIGANTAIYSFMDAILMRALPVRDPDSLVVLNWHSKGHPPVAHSFSGSSRSTFSPALLHSLRFLLIPWFIARCCSSFFTCARMRTSL